MRKFRMYNPPHPGQMLKEMYIEPLGLTVTDTAKALNISRKNLSEIINGHTGISPEMALRLSKAFDTSAKMWLNMQQVYDLWQVEQKKDILENVQQLYTAPEVPEETEVGQKSPVHLI